jgi:hypothetical protein
MSIAAEPVPTRAIGTLRDDMNRLRGRLFQAIEAAGMPTKQETAVKALIRQLTYDAQANLEAALRHGA